jgi:hypothetical protein
MDWKDLEIEIGKGGGALEEGEHIFELVDIQHKEKVVVNPDAPNEARGKEFDELDEDLKEEIEPKWCADSLTLVLKEEESNMILNTSFWVRNLRVNLSDDERYRSKFGDFLERCGFDLEENIGRRIRVGDLIKIGNKYKGETFKDGEYSRIDQDTLSLVSSSTPQSKLTVEEPPYMTELTPDEERVLNMMEKMEGQDEDAIVSIILKEASNASADYKIFQDLIEKGAIRKEDNKIFLS